MRIKLVTFAPHPNFGTCLQSYALNSVLRNMGHDVEFIYNGRDWPSRGFYGNIKDLFKYILPASFVERIRSKKKRTHATINSITDVAKHIPPEIITLPNSYLRYLISFIPFYEIIYKYWKCRSLQWVKVYKFTYEDDNYKMKRLYIMSQYAAVEKDADIFITGSDQIWNPYCGGFNPMMFLEFVKNTKCIAYSSSISRTEFPIEVRERARKDLSKFQHIAVRERMSVNMLKSLLGRDDIQQVVDPTYLLSSQQWIEFGDRAQIEFSIPERYIFCYFIGFRREDYQSMVEDVKMQTGLIDVITVDCVNCNINYGGGILYKDAGPYEFIYLLKHASFVCMDSFHATVFSLKFHIDFAHILKTKEETDQTSQNIRMHDLLNYYGLSYKLYYGNSSSWLKPINWDVVDQKMNKEIKESLRYLENAISC